MSVRQPPRTVFEFVERGWRLALVWLLIFFLVAPLVLFIAVVLGAIAFGLIKAVMTGQPMPDVTGGLDRVLAQIMPYVGPAVVTGLGTLITAYLARGREVVQLQRIRGGGSGRPPFGESSPPSSASMPAGYSEAPPEGGPRPVQEVPPA